MVCVHFGHLLRPGIEFSPCAHEGPKAAAVGDEEFGLTGELVSAQHAVILLSDLASQPMATISPSMSRLEHAKSPQVILDMQAIGMKSLQASGLDTHSLPLQTVY
jgi:hypothetical protein